MTKIFNVTLLILTVGLLITGCATGVSTEPTATIPPTATNEPTTTPEPTATAKPTATPELTAEPVSEFESFTDEERVDALFDAIRDNDLVTVSELLAIGTDVNAVERVGGLAPITVATIRNNLEIFTLLLEAGADATVIDDRNNNLLHHAALTNGVEIASILLTLDGIDIEHKSDRGAGGGPTPLHLAAFEDNLEMVELLVAHGANLEARDEYGDTALNLAAWSGYLAVVQKLVELGARTDAKNNYGDAALDHARTQSRDEVEAFLLSLMGE